MCPHLGRLYDPDTLLCFPSASNSCHRMGAAQAISLAHQEGYCFSPSYKGCEIYKHGKLDKPVRRIDRAIVTVISTVLIVIAALIIFFIVNDPSVPALGVDEPSIQLNAPMAKPVTSFNADHEQTQGTGSAVDSAAESEATPTVDDEASLDQPPEDPPAAEFSVIDY